MKPGDRITVLTSIHSSINPGDEGVIEERISKGYGIKFTKQFPQITCGNVVTLKEETRVLWLPEDSIKKIK